MKYLIPNGLIAIIFLFLAGCTTSSETSNTAQTTTITREPMTTESLIAALSGNTGFGVNTSGKNFIQVYNADGSLESGSLENRGPDGKWVAKEIGTWKVVDGKMCNKYTEPKVRDGGCDAYYKTSDGRYEYQVASGKWGKLNEVRLGRSPDAP